jgi:hypothetical protein
MDESERERLKNFLRTGADCVREGADRMGRAIHEFRSAQDEYDKARGHLMAALHLLDHERDPSVLRLRD